jgi:hypothetical protein
MIIKIPFHEYDINFAHEDLDYYPDRIQTRLIKIGKPEHPNLTLRDIAEDAISYAGLLSQLRPCCTDLGNTIRQGAYAWNANSNLKCNTQKSLHKGLIGIV